MYQGCFVWGQLIELNPDLPSPTEWGWKIEDNIFQPFGQPYQKLPKYAMSSFIMDAKLAAMVVANVFKLLAMVNATETDIYSA